MGRVDGVVRGVAGNVPGHPWWLSAGSERGLVLVAAGGAAGPRVVVAAGLEALPAAGAAGLGHLGGGVLHRRSDLVHVDLEDGALLALAGLVGPRLEAARDDDPHAAGQRLGGVLGRLPPYRAVQEQRLAVLPLVR